MTGCCDVCVTHTFQLTKSPQIRRVCAKSLARCLTAAASGSIGLRWEQSLSSLGRSGQMPYCGCIRQHRAEAGTIPQLLGRYGQCAHVDVQAQPCSDVVLNRTYVLRSSYTSIHTFPWLYYFRPYLTGCGRDPCPSIILSPTQMVAAAQV